MSITNLSEYTHALNKHPDVQRAKRLIAKRHQRKMPGWFGPIPKVRKNERLIAPLQMARAWEPRLLELTQCIRRVIKYYRESMKLLHACCTGNASPKQTDHSAFFRKWSGIEQEYRRMIRLYAELSLDNPLTLAYAQATSNYPNESRVFSNPAFLGQEEQAIIQRQLGLRLKELALFYEHIYLPYRQRVIKTTDHPNNLRQLLQETRKFALKAQFVIAPDNLFAGGVMVVRGDFCAPVVNVLIQIASAAASTFQWVAAASHSTAVAIAEGSAGGAQWASESTTEVVEIGLKNAKETVDADEHGPDFVEELGHAILVNFAKGIPKPVGIDPDPGPPPFPDPSVGENDPGPIVIPIDWDETGGLTSISESFVSPNEIIDQFGYFLGNISRSKLELHTPNCPFIHLVKPTNLRRISNLDEAEILGLDNCHYCIGDSKR